MRQSILILFAIALAIPGTKAQDLLSMLDSIGPAKPGTVYQTAAFKSVRLINGYTTEFAGENELVFTISHRFNSVKSGIHDLFGIDHSTIRFGFEYGLSDKFDLGLGRSSNLELYDGFMKIKLATQSVGEKKFPVSIALLEGFAVSTFENLSSEIDYPLVSRMYYVHELLVSRKFNEKLSLQLMPVVLHRNRVKAAKDQNTVPAIGLGGRYKITNRFTFNGEYYYLLPGQTADDYENSLSFGIGIETGGHVFQIQLSNSRGMTEKAFLPENTTSWLDGEIHLGFNIMRIFSFN